MSYICVEYFKYFIYTLYMSFLNCALDVIMIFDYDHDIRSLNKHKQTYSRYCVVF